MNFFLRGQRLVASMLVVFLLLFSCSKQESAVSSRSEPGVKSGLRTWQKSETVITVFFGYGFNDKEFMDKTMNLLYSKFGSEADGGLIRCTVFPDDYLIGKTPRISLIADIPEDTKVRGLILLGAPEGTHFGLAKLQDKYEAFPVFNLFSQDDVLGIEAGSALVLDAERGQETTANAERLQLNKEYVPDMMVHIVKFMKTGSPLEKNEALRLQVEKMLNSQWTVRFYADAETGLRSSNHFIIEKKD